MTLRTPPRLASWLLEHLGPRYQRESLAGDLFEEFQQRRSYAWYWRQVLIAIVAERVVHAAALLSRLGTSTVLRLCIEAAALLGFIALSQQFLNACLSWPVASLTSIAVVIGTIGVVASARFYFSLYLRSQRTAGSGRMTPIRRLLATFVITALSAGTLTWAGSAPHAPYQCTRMSGFPID